MRAIAVDLLLDPASRTPLPEQLVRQLRIALAQGTLRPGDRMPSSRTLAVQLGVSRGTVVAGYEQLLAEGLLVARERSAVMVNPALKIPPQPFVAPPPSPVPDAGGPPLRWDLTPGHESAVPLHDPAWRAALRRAADPPHREGWHVDELGDAALRQAIAEHLRTVRGMPVQAASVVVTAGARDALALAIDALRQAGRGTGAVAVEAPGFPGLRSALLRRGVRVRPVPSDARGPLPRGVRPGTADALLLTPNRQFPGGTALDAERRMDLLRAAVHAGMLVLEDDYDSEFRHLGAALPSLWSLDSENVAHLGTFSGVTTRDVGTGYLVVPPSVAAAVHAVRADLGCPVPPSLQRALATYLAEGGLRRRIARGRRRLQACQRVVAQARDELPNLVDSGHLLVLEAPQDHAAALRARCLARGLAVGSMSDGWSDEAQARCGIVLDYGMQQPDALRQALRVLGEELRR